MKYILIIAWVLQTFIVHSQDTTAYQKVLQQLNAERVALNKKKDQSNLSTQCSDLLYTTLVKEIFPAWYNTPWDFNGTSNIPGKGEIACGYFVSTTLKHAGFNLNRYRLAQQAASVIASAFCPKKRIKRFQHVIQILNYLSQQPNGVFIVGLDYHVGFIVVENKEVYFVHSDYYNLKVVKEKAKDSAAFTSSEIYVLGEITSNKELMNKWLKGTKIY